MVLGDKELQVGIYADSISNIEFLDPSCLNPIPEPLQQKNIKGFVKGELKVKTRERRILLMDSEAVMKFLKKIQFKQEL
jgi:chemotaxis signal transduction protein